MDQNQLVQQLLQTQSPAQGPRQSAEQALLDQYHNPAFPLALVEIAHNTAAALEIRQAALLSLKNYVLAGWSSTFDEFRGQVLLDDANKAPVRENLLALATNDTIERRLQNLASNVVSKIASADFPEDWPNLLGTLLQLIGNASDSRLHGVLKVLAELINDGFDEGRFLQTAQDIIGALQVVALEDARKYSLRALAVFTFKGCFDMLEMIMEENKAAVKGFAEQTINSWMPYFINIIKTPLPPAPEGQSPVEEGSALERYRGLISLKIQVVQTLVKIRTIFPSLIAPQSPSIFASVWDELSSLQATYQSTYIDDDREGRLEDADGLPYTLDFLVLEDLDLMQACIRAPPVRRELESQLQNQSTWLTDLIKLATLYAQITTEEEGMWGIDVNVFLAEETSVTTNYTARIACGDLIIKVGEWLKQTASQGILTVIESLFSSARDWRQKEAALFVLTQHLNDIADTDRRMDVQTCEGLLNFAQQAQQHTEPFLSARAFLVSAAIIKTAAGPSDSQLYQVATNNLLPNTFKHVHEDPSEVVQVSCIRATQQYLSALPHSSTKPLQLPIIQSLQEWINSKDLADFSDSDDLLVLLVETLRDAILLDARVCLNGDGLNALFQLASRDASNFQTTQILSETFDEICGTLASIGSSGPVNDNANDAYVQLSQRVLPSLTGAFDVGGITEENALTNLAAELLATLAKHGTSPLPPGFVAAIMPKLQRLLLGSNDSELLQSCTLAVKHILHHDPQQLLMEYHDPREATKSGLDVVLSIISRLLTNTGNGSAEQDQAVDDTAATEVGGLAAELVTSSAVREKLQPYLPQLLQAVAQRLALSTRPQLTQSLASVFAHLCAAEHAADVVEFLSGTTIVSSTADSTPRNGLEVVLQKWLTSSSDFAGADEIRTNAIALTRLFSLHDSRLPNVPVQGDMIVTPESAGRIVTRSRAKAQKATEEWTTVSAQVKIVKIVLDEIESASRPSAASLMGTPHTPGMPGGLGDGANGDGADEDEFDDEDDDEDWEDEPGSASLLANPATRAELLAFANEEPGGGMSRGADDETGRFLVEWVRSEARLDGFESDVFAGLNESEQSVVRSLVGGT